MRLKVGVIALGSFVALAAFGCGDDGRSSATDAGMMIFLDGAMPDAPVNDTDAGPGTDAGPRRDAGPTECTVATACEPTRGCPGVGESCIAAVATEIGGEDDPIRREDADGGIQPAVPITYWRGGYCTPGAPTLVTSEGACDPNAAAGEDGCGSCAECISLGEQDGVGIVMCVRSCEPSVTENPCPQMGQACNFGSNVCFPGCSSDDECRVFRPDSNGDGVITDFDPTNGSGTVDGGTAMVDPDCFGGEPPIGCGDLLMYDGESDAVCNGHLSLRTRHNRHRAGHERHRW